MAFDICPVVNSLDVLPSPFQGGPAVASVLSAEWCFEQAGYG